MKIAERIRPDAIIVDLMMETVDAGSKVSSRLKASGFMCPIRLLSAAGDSVRYNIDIQELGLAGIFQKPADPHHTGRDTENEASVSVRPAEGRFNVGTDFIR